jgi:hypothetical protein
MRRAHPEELNDQRNAQLQADGAHPQADPRPKPTLRQMQRLRGTTLEQPTSWCQRESEVKCEKQLGAMLLTCSSI